MNPKSWVMESGGFDEFFEKWYPMVIKPGFKDKRARMKDHSGSGFQLLYPHANSVVKGSGGKIYLNAAEFAIGLQVA